MADTTTTAEVNIVTRGGPEAAAAINKARGAVDELAAGGASLDNAFGKKLSSIGLVNLNYELLHSIEYTGKAKPVIGALNMAWMSLASGVGLTTSALFPYIAGIVAVIAIYSKMKGAHEDAVVALDKVIAATKENMSKTGDILPVFEEYKEKVGNLTDAQSNYYEALKKSNKELAAQQVANYAADIKALDDKIKANTETISNNEKVQKHYSDALVDSTGIYADNSAGIAGMAIAAKQSAKNTEQAKEENKKFVVQLAEAKASMESYAKANKDVVGALKDGIKAETDAEKAEKERMATDNKDADARIKLYNKSAELQKKLDKDINEAHKKALADKFALEQSVAGSMVTVNEVAANTIKENLRGAYLEMMKGVGDSFAKMIVDGESFKKGMEEVFKSILRSFISMLAEMVARYAAIKFLTAGLGISPVSLGLHATGADYMVDRPTMFMAGENGPERVNVAPMGSNRLGDGATGGGGSTSVTNHFTISGATDPQKVADIVAQKIIYSIRGRGQLNFVRGA